LIDGAETVIGFRNVNFGNFGSDEITIPIFSPDQEEFSIEIWDGLPGESGSELINTVIYTKGSIWNVYQEQSYKLQKRFCGIKTISFVLRKRLHIKGFWFKFLRS
jgi:beta-galactosidase